MSDKKKSKVPRYSTGTVAIQLYSNLLRDFRTTEGPAFYRNTDFALLTDVKSFRAFKRPEMDQVSVCTFKRHKQMDALLKKFRFSTDAFTDEELSEKTRNAFIEEQIRLHRPMELKVSGFMVLQRARLIARRILGDYPGDEVIENVRFGRKSSIGCPLSLAFIDIKLSVKRAFTATKDTAAYFFDTVLPGDHILSRILKNHKVSELKEQLSYTYLNLVEVPKTWKTYRLITPLTLLGLFFSYGVGRVVQSRLKDAGLDISRLQEVHAAIIKAYSVTCSHVTADLSAASDSITSEMLNRILPRPWYVALKKTFVRQLNIDGRMVSTASVLPMGNGATFPVETLVFYCIIKAIGELTEVEGTYSVYGDDLIYPTPLHKYVVGIFPQLHLKLNSEKTFVDYQFRESCGSDFYRGQDVRPYFLKGDAEYLTRVRYEAFLYQVYNGLTARWEPLEIRQTLTWLLSELSVVSHGLCRVPPSFPSYSGIKVERFTDVPLDYHLLPFKPINARFVNGTLDYQFDYLTETSKQRIVEFTQPYYWLALQGLNDEVDESYSYKRESFTDRAFKSWLHRLSRLTKSDVSALHEARESNLSWKKVKKSTVFWHKGRKVVKDTTKYVPVVASRVGSTVSTATTKTGSITYWI